MRSVERDILLRIIDDKWIGHLHSIDALKDGIGLRAYGQKDPLIEYKNEAFTCFKTMLGRVRTDVCTGLFRSATSYEAFEQLIRRLRGIEIPEEKTEAPKRAVAVEKSAVADSILGTSGVPVAESESVPAGLSDGEIGRNDLVEIELNGETRVAKWKKAQALIANEGWTFVKKV